MAWAMGVTPESRGGGEGLKGGHHTGWEGGERVGGGGGVRGVARGGGGWQGRMGDGGEGGPPRATRAEREVAWAKV